MKREWVLNILQQCREQNVKFFFKQWGGVHKSKTGRLLDGRTYDEFPDAVQNRIANVAVRRMHAARMEA
jgi:protein gp37